MFKGFGLKYPEYEVITPQTKKSFTIKSLTVSEEENLKGSFQTPTKLTDHLNRCLYDSCVKKPADITDFSTFLKNTTIKDRDALVFGLYHITYDDIRNYEVKCSRCKKDYPLTVKASEMFNYNIYPGEDIISKQVRVDLPISTGVSVYIKQPTLEDEANSIKTLMSTPGVTMDMITESLIIDRFEQTNENSKDPSVIYNIRGDIIDAYRSLPAKDKRLILDSYESEFGKYRIDLKMRSVCQYCANDEIIEVDLVAQFFRMVYTS